MNDVSAIKRNHDAGWHLVAREPECIDCQPDEVYVVTIKTIMPIPARSRAEAVSIVGSRMGRYSNYEVLSVHKFVGTPSQSIDTPGTLVEVVSE